jgi:hypothetical protein
MKILNFFDFIIESYQKIEVPFQFTHEFDHILREIDSPISKELIKVRLNPSDISLINISDQNDEVTFTTSIKLSQHFKTEDYKQLSLYVRPLNNSSSQIYHINRTSIKIGRLVRKLFQNKFTDVEIEKFVNQFKSQVDSKLTHFYIWEGSRISQGYRSKNYTYDGARSNPLLNSCMHRYFILSMLMICVEWMHHQLRSRIFFMIVFYISYLYILYYVVCVYCVNILHLMCLYGWGIFL